MSDEAPYPEQHPLKYQGSENLLLLVDTDTNKWRFKLVYDDLAAGEAKAVQDGEVLTLQSFWIQNVAPKPEGWLKGVWRTISLAKPKPANLKSAALGQMLLGFVIQRAKDFLASEIIADTNTGGFEQLPDGDDWLKRQGFQIETMPAEGVPSCKLRLVLVAESKAPVPSQRITTPKKPRPQSRLVVSSKDQSTRDAKPRRIPRGKDSDVARTTKNLRQDFTRESLTKLFRPLSDFINGKLEDTQELLDPAIRDRLKASNKFIRHGGDTRVLQYHIWDRAQPSIFHRHHFKYEVQYDPFGTKAGTATLNFCVHFYMNKIRIYHEREEMLGRVRRELSRIRLTGFKLKETERAFSFYHNFKATTADGLLKEVQRYLFPLLNQVHPMFYRIMDAYNISMTKAQRRAVISGRTKLSFVDRNSPNYGRNAEFRRDPPPRLRIATFQRDNYTCQHCERKFAVSMLHADHVIPVARGGLTVLANMQALCGPCNLKKGKRLEAEL